MTYADEAAGHYLATGSVELQEFKGLKVGSRVYQRNQLWTEATRHGTGTIRRIFLRPDSTWEKTYGRPDVELIVERDNPRGDDTHIFVADYHVALAEEQP